MMGIPCDDTDYIERYNKSVPANTTVPDYTYKNNNQSVAYNFVKEGSARDEWRTTCVKPPGN